MSQKPLVVVSGITGAQGGSVVNSLLVTGRFRIRGLTRNPDSDKSKALAAKGIEVVKCDLSINEDVKNALKDADIAWIVTNFGDPSIFPNNVGEEERQGKMIADVAKETGLNWLIYSSSGSAGEKYPRLTQMNGKNNVEQYIRTLGIPNSTFVYVDYYFQNFEKFTYLKKNGELELAIPYLEENDALPLIDSEEDTGPIVVKIIEDEPSKWNGKTVPAIAEYATMKHIVDTLTKVTGKTHKLRTLGDEEIAKEFPFLNAEELKQMYKFYKYGVSKDNKLKDISISKKLYPNIKTYEQYLLKTYGKK